MTHGNRRRPLLAFEGRHQPLAPVRVFRRRLVASSSVAVGLIAFSLLLGVAGYHWIGGLESWVDCVYNASMILGGMGPVAEMKTGAAKLFASAYAIYSGVVLLASVGVMLSPVLHRVLHRFHVETDEESGS
jgi:hypothetical protein